MEKNKKQKKTPKKQKGEKKGSYDTAASLPRQQVTRPQVGRGVGCGVWDMYMCRARRGAGAVTSPHPPRCSSRGLSRRTDRDRGTCAACPGQTPWRWSQSPSSLSSFSVFGLPGLLETVGGEDTSLASSLAFTAFPLSLTSRMIYHVVPVPKDLGSGPKKYLHLDPTKFFHPGPK